MRKICFLKCTLFIIWEFRSPECMAYSVCLLVQPSRPKKNPSQKKTNEMISAAEIQHAILLSCFSYFPTCETILLLLIIFAEFHHASSCVIIESVHCLLLNLLSLSLFSSYHKYFRFVIL